MSEPVHLSSQCYPRLQWTSWLSQHHCSLIYVIHELLFWFSVTYSWHLHSFALIINWSIHSSEISLLPLSNLQHYNDRMFLCAVPCIWHWRFRIILHYFSIFLLFCCQCLKEMKSPYAWSVFLIFKLFCICCIIILCHKNVYHHHYKVFTFTVFCFWWPVKCWLPQLWSACFGPTAYCIPSGGCSPILPTVSRCWLLLLWFWWLLSL